MYFSRQGTNGYVYLDLDENFAYWLYYVLDHRFDFKIQPNITHRAPGKAGKHLSHSCSRVFDLYFAGCHISLFLRGELNILDRTALSYHVGRRVSFNIEGLVSSTVRLNRGESRLLLGFEATSKTFHDVRQDVGLIPHRKEQRFHASLLYVSL